MLCIYSSNIADHISEDFHEGLPKDVFSSLLESQFEERWNGNTKFFFKNIGSNRRISLKARIDQHCRSLRCHHKKRWDQGSRWATLPFTDFLTHLFIYMKLLCLKLMVEDLPNKVFSSQGLLHPSLRNVHKWSVFSSHIKLIDIAGHSRSSFKKRIKCHSHYEIITWSIKDLWLMGLVIYIWFTSILFSHT